MEEKIYFINANSVEETVNAINSINARTHTEWVISLNRSETRIVFSINITRKKETRRKGNDWVYTLALTFTYRGQKYTAHYSDIYLSRLLKTKRDIILTRLKQSYYGRSE